MNADRSGQDVAESGYRRDVVHRRRLVELLNDGLWQEDGFVRKLTLVSAPAGYGKTTLVSEWLHGSPYAAAWLSLDSSDNDPARFLAYLIAAVRQLHTEFAAATLAILQLPQPPPASVILTSLVNELSGLAVRFILALDDYHVIHTAEIHQQLAFILDNQPKNVHLVIMTREDPLLPIARLRARGQLLEIRQDALRFTEDEAAEFLHRGAGLSLSTDDMAALERHTEGWAAGLQLTALSLRGRSDLPAFIRDFTRSDRYILDYLAEEVFGRQPAEVQDFLLQTSILERLSGPLCDAVTGHTGSAEMLRNLEQANLFVTPLDPLPTWYRYHHLFAELLHYRLRLSAFSEVDLHQRAARWHEAHGLLDEAIEQSLAAYDWGSAARLIGAVSEGMFKRGEVVTLLNWCGGLPQEVVYTSPELCLAHAWAALLASRFDVAAPILERAEALAKPGSQFLGRVSSGQAFLARAQRDRARAIEKSEQALLLLPEDDLVQRGNIAMNLGLSYWHEGRLAEAEPVLVQACDLCGRAENTFALLTSQIFLARIAAAQGRLRHAATMFEQLIQAAGQAPILCLAHYDLATIYLEWNDLPKAMGHFAHGFALGQRSGNAEFQQSGHLLKAILAWAQGDEPGSLAALSEADLLARDFPVTVRSRTAAFGVQVALARNDPQLIAHWAAQVNAEVDAHSFYRFVGLTRARLLIAQGEKAQAAEELRRLFETASAAGWGYAMVTVRILQSSAAQTEGEAVQFLSDALSRGQPEGFIRSFVDAGRAIIPLLHEAARRGISPEYVGQILAAVGAGRSKETSEDASLVEPLSEREVEVLRLAAAGLSNREIARKLVISPGTAKTHIHNVCAKLGVRNRTEAAMRAKELGLT